MCQRTEGGEADSGKRPNFRKAPAQGHTDDGCADNDEDRRKRIGTLQVTDCVDERRLRVLARCDALDPTMHSDDGTRRLCQSPG